MNKNNLIDKGRDYLIWACDFDGTLCKFKFPDIGKPNKQIINFVKQRRKKGDKIILWTCRSGRQLKEALKWCSRLHKLKFDAINRDLPEIEKIYGDGGRKVFADVYLDDKNVILGKNKKGETIVKWRIK